MSITNTTMKTLAGNVTITKDSADENYDVSRVNSNSDAFADAITGLTENATTVESDSTTYKGTLSINSATYTITIIRIGKIRVAQMGIGEGTTLSEYTGGNLDICTLASGDRPKAAVSSKGLARDNGVWGSANYTPVSLGKLIKDGILADIDSIHRMTIDHAVEKKKKKEESIDG